MRQSVSWSRCRVRADGLSRAATSVSPRMPTICTRRPSFSCSRASFIRFEAFVFACVPTRGRRRGGRAGADGTRRAGRGPAGRRYSAGACPLSRRARALWAASMWSRTPRLSADEEVGQMPSLAVVVDVFHQPTPPSGWTSVGVDGRRGAELPESHELHVGQFPRSMAVLASRHLIFVGDDQSLAPIPARARTPLPKSRERQLVEFPAGCFERRVVVFSCPLPPLLHLAAARA
jgi:hypothetical protein